MQLEDANMRIYTMDIQDGKERRGIQGNNSCKLPTVTENYGLHIQKNQHTPSRKILRPIQRPAGNAGITIKSQKYFHLKFQQKQWRTEESVSARLSCSKKNS